MKPTLDYTLYLCTDRRLMKAADLESAVRQAIAGGCSVVQLREKDCTSREFYEQAVRLKSLTDMYSVPLLINDRLDIALAVDAAGIHIGQEDIPVAAARQILGKDKIIGVSAGSVNEALKAERQGADYIGVGAMYATPTKKDADIVSCEILAEIRRLIHIPIVIIGGINRNTAGKFAHMGIDGLAVVSAVIAAENITQAARELRDFWLAQK